MAKLHNLVCFSEFDGQRLSDVGYLILLWVPPSQVLVQVVHKSQECQLHTKNKLLQDIGQIY